MVPPNLILKDGFDNSGVIKKSLIPRQWACSKCDDLLLISKTFIIATAFGHVYGVYKAENVKLQPELLEQFQVYVSRSCVKRIRSSSSPTVDWVL